MAHRDICPRCRDPKGDAGDLDHFKALNAAHDAAEDELLRMSWMRLHQLRRMARHAEPLLASVMETFATAEAQHLMAWLKIRRIRRVPERARRAQRRKAGVA